MNYELPAPTLNYVRQHADEDVRLVALRGCKDPDVDLTLALQQIQGRQTARTKLPTWTAIDGIVYPPHLNLEQCSSEQTARYKAALCRRLLTKPPEFLDKPSGKAGRGGWGAEQLSNSKSSNSKLLDLTGGFGVDFAFMQEAFDEATYVELNPQLFAIATANFHTLGLNVSCHNTDAVSFLKSLPKRERTEELGGEKASPNWGRLEGALIFLDPARRDSHGQRTYGIADCTPDVLALKDELLQKAVYVLLKLSPMLDWRKAVTDLGPQNVREVHIVSVRNECKELLILLSAIIETPPTLHCVNDDDTFTLHCVNDGDTFSIALPPPSPLSSLLQFAAIASPPSLPPSPPSLPPSPLPLEDSGKAFLLEPNASIMKAGCFDALAARFSVTPLSHDSHLFISPHLIEGFPGRQFLISATSSLNKRDLKTALRDITRANITTRNFPLSAPALRQRLKLADGGDTYIFATTLADNTHILLICKKLPS